MKQSSPQDQTGFPRVITNIPGTSHDLINTSQKNQFLEQNVEGQNWSSLFIMVTSLFMSNHNTLWCELYRQSDTVDQYLLMQSVSLLGIKIFRFSDVYVSFLHPHLCHCYLTRWNLGKEHKDILRINIKVVVNNTPDIRKNFYSKSISLSKMWCYLLLYTIIQTQVIWSHGRCNVLNTSDYNQFELSFMWPKCKTH